MPSVLADLPEGSIFAGEFRIVRKLGAGGMGALYVAEQVGTGRQRALKLMHPGMVSSADLRQKFTLEAKVGARIASEHVVEVVAAGIDAESGVPWLAMELLVGEDLARHVETRGPMPLGEAALVLDQVGHALSAAHQAGIVHRDLKPENVFLAQTRRANESFIVKLLDFGIAKVVEEARGTNTGVMGSPLWMAPEQTEHHATITPATDVWALGLVAFYMLTGRNFWRAATGGSESFSFTAFLRELVLEELSAASVRGGGARAPAGDDPRGLRRVVRPLRRARSRRTLPGRARGARGVPRRHAVGPRPSAGRGARAREGRPGRFRIASLWNHRRAARNRANGRRLGLPRERYGARLRPRRPPGRRAAR